MMSAKMTRPGEMMSVEMTRSGLMMSRAGGEGGQCGKTFGGSEFFTGD